MYQDLSGVFPGNTGRFQRLRSEAVLPNIGPLYRLRCNLDCSHFKDVRTGDVPMATPSRLARLGIGAASCTRAPACFQVRCMSTAQTISASPAPAVLPSGVRKALQASSLRQSSQLVSHLQVWLVTCGMYALSSTCQEHTSIGSMQEHMESDSCERLELSPSCLRAWLDEAVHAAC